MAHTTENSNLVWQKVKLALADADPMVQDAFRAVKAKLAQSKGNPNLKFTAIIGATNGSDGGDAATVASDAAAQLLGIYLKKSTGTTLALNAIANHASAIQAQKEVILGNTAAGEISFAVYPNGLAFATGITYSSVTAYNGTTRSLSVDSSSGFILSLAA